MLNLKLLNEVFDLIEQTPDKWSQGEWVSSVELSPAQLDLFKQGKYELCGTTACVAGWAMLRSGQYKPELGKAEYGEANMITGFVSAYTGKDIQELAGDLGIEEDEVFLQEGVRLLGLTQDQAKYIFLNANYDANFPRTFTDKIRTFLELPTKWGATFKECDGCLCEDHLCQVVTEADETRQPNLADIQLGADLAAAVNEAFTNTTVQ